jgi:hypothetical protein
MADYRSRFSDQFNDPRADEINQRVLEVGVLLVPFGGATVAGTVHLVRYARAAFYAKPGRYVVGDFAEVAGKVSRQKQWRHVAGRREYRGGGILNSLDDAQKVLGAYRSGSTTILGRSKDGFPVVRYDGVTGTNINVGAGISGQPTNIFMIKGTKNPSIVPMNPNWTPRQ